MLQIKLRSIDINTPAGMMTGKTATVFLFMLMTMGTAVAQNGNSVVRFIDVAPGWANNSVNTVPFRKNSLFTFRDTQFIAFYDPEQYMVLGKRQQNETAWKLHRTRFRGTASDAHNAISIVVDGEGFLHVAWDHHNHPLRYARSSAPSSLDLSEKMPMTGTAEEKVSYPEFYALPGGDLLFFYRDGGSGQGNLVINRYYTVQKRWVQLHQNLIDGERQRNAYWQACTDATGVIHVSWVWRESPDVASNHDLCYARSIDGGLTWENSAGQPYQLPITAASAEYAARIPQKSELINQTSMATDDLGRPFIITYWRSRLASVPYYQIVYHDGKKWRTSALALRQTPFTLLGVGSKRIPIARPQLVVSGRGKRAAVSVIFRDEERGSRVSVATTRNLKKNDWVVQDLSSFSVGSWEPTLDIVQWQKHKMVHLFVQPVEQVDGEGKANLPPTMVQVMEWKPFSGANNR